MENKEKVIEDEQLIEPNERHYKIVIPLLMFLIFISIGFAYLSSNLKITSGIGIPKMSWDVHFENIIEDPENTITPRKSATLISDNTKVEFDIELTYPRDKYGFDVDITNDGTIDAMLEDYSIDGISVSQLDIVNYTLTYKDGSAIRSKDLLKSGDTVTIHFNIVYKDVIIDEDQHMHVVIDFNYIQADETAIERD